MFDAEFEFYKVRNLLSRSPRLLREDPILGTDYLRIIGLIKQKKLLERSSDKFDPTISADIHYYDYEKEELKKQELLQIEMEKKVKELETDLTGQDSGMLDREQNMETQIKNEKKAKAREQLKILKQFESMAE